MRLHTKDNRFGITRGEKYLKIQIGWFRLYLSRIPMKPKHESRLRRGFRRDILRRSPCCEICGRPLTLGTLSVHHVKPKSIHPELMYEPSNCMALCAGCHVQLHVDQKEMKKRCDTIPVITVPALMTKI